MTYAIIIIIACITGATVLGVAGHPWLALLLCILAAGTRYKEKG